MASPTHISAPTQITIRPPGQLFEGEAFSWRDAVDTINPLQHIPFVSTLYRETTGDTAGAGSTLLGGALFGGVFGFIAGLADVIFESATGKTMGGAVMAALRGETNDAPVQLANREVNLGDFAGDVRRSILQRATNLTPTALATALQAPAETQMAAATTSSPDSLEESRAASIAIDATQRQNDEAILSLFGGGVAGAHQAYEQARLNAAPIGTTTNLVL